MLRPKIFLIACLLASVWCPQGRGDGGTPRLRERAGPYLVSVFTAPTPFRAGPVDVSVFVQDAETGAQLAQAQVTVKLVDLSDPAGIITHPATTGTATNKLYHAAKFDLPRAGRWSLTVCVSVPGGTAEVRCEVEAADPLPRWLEMLPWIAWPVLVIVLFGLHLFLVRRSSRSGVARL